VYDESAAPASSSTAAPASSSTAAPVGGFDADAGGDSGEFGVVGDALDVVSWCAGRFKSAGVFVGECDFE